MATVEKDRRYGRVNQGDTIPYGTLADASYELRKTYYYYGYPKDTDFPELPVLEPEVIEVDPEKALIAQELARVVQEMLDSLTPREAKVLRLRYGVDVSCDHTLEEIGQLFDVTRERIRQIEAKALRKLKHPTRHAQLYQFIESSVINLKAHTRMEAVVKYYQHKAKRGW